MSYTSNIIEVKGSGGIIKDMSKWQNNKKNIVSEFETDINGVIKGNVPSNYGNKWTDEERKKLIKLLKNSYDVDVIADKLNRSEGGVKAEIKKIVYAKYIEGNDAEAISKELNIVYNNVKSMIKVSIDKECENDINNLEKENKLLRLKIENIRLHKKLASINKKS